MIQTINNWVNEEERKTLVDFILSNDEKNKKLGPDQLLSTSQPGELRSSTYMLKDSLTNRWKEFNFLSEPIVNKILATSNNEFLEIEVLGTSKFTSGDQILLTLP